MAYTTIDDPTIFFNTQLRNGLNGGSDTAFDIGFQPDWIWDKSRSATGVHSLFDSVRGFGSSGKVLYSNTTGAEATNALIKSVSSTGFTITASSDNSTSVTIVDWCWKAGTSFTNDASATGIGTIDSTGSVSTTAGFSIISFTGQTGTVAHGLGVKPSMIILKCREIANNWVIQHKGLTGGMDEKALIFTTSAEISAATAEPTTSVFTVNNQIAENNDNIAYIFSDIKGYSKFGSYTGNGSADGTFVYTGFRPAFVIIKPSSYSNSWLILDNKRNTFNPTNTRLEADGNGADYSGLDYTDFLSNGFKIRTSNSHPNTSGGTLIYMAFAESPFVNSNGVPNNAK